MASKEDEGGCVTLTWEIQNFSLLLPLEKGNYCSTPFWKTHHHTTEHTGYSVWRRLRIYIYGSRIRFGIIPVKDRLHLDRCEASLISSCMEVQLSSCLRSLISWFFDIERDAVFGERRQSVLPNDTLTLRCKMWEKTMSTREFRFNSALHRFTYLWKIENVHASDFHSEYIEKENFLYKVYLEKNNENYRHKFILGEVGTVERYVSPIYCKLSQKDDVLGYIRQIREDKYNNRVHEIEIVGLCNNLNIQLESVFAVHEVCQDPFKLHSPNHRENESEAISGALGADLFLLYRDKLFSDATLKTEGKSFHVHRSILSARSPVFRAMFEKDEMSEGRSGVVVIDDVDNETLDRMLVFLYGDSLESVQKWEEASALYYAADKYAIQPLKQKCASILKDGLTADNACEALVLADRHSDDELMMCIVDFIRQNEEVISSKKWDSLQNSNPLLAAKILRDMFVKNKKK